MSELTRLFFNNSVFFHQLKRRSLQMSSEFACGTTFDDFEDCASDGLSVLNEEFDSSIEEALNEENKIQFQDWISK